MTEGRRARAPRGKRRVLLVEHYTALRELMASVLEEAGWHVITVRHAGEVESMLSRHKPALAIFSADPPEHVDEGCLREALAGERCRSVPVVVTGGQPELEHMAEDVGAAAFLRKPFNLRDLFNAVERAAPA